MLQEKPKEGVLEEGKEPHAKRRKTQEGKTEVRVLGDIGEFA